MPTPRYSYEENNQRYRDAKTGRFVSRAFIDGVIERQIAKTQKDLLDLGQQLKDGKIELNEWRLQSLDKLKTIHIANAALAAGGVDRMTQADFGRVGGVLKKQYEYFNKLSSEIQYGAQPLDGRLDMRLKMYAEASFDTYELQRGAIAENDGYDEERNVLDPAAEHCEECLDETAKGWVPIGTLSRIGSRKCLTRDRCHKEYRNSKTGKTFD